MNSNLVKAFIGLSTKERFAKNPGQEIVQVKVNLRDDSYVVPSLAVNWYHCFDSELKVLT